MERILVTGGLGFIGSNLLERLLISKPNCLFINIDSETYAANQNKKNELSKRDNYYFERVDITHRNKVRDVLEKYEPDHVIHLAAESHVCRSIEGPDKFFETNAIGTFNLIDEFRHLHRKKLSSKRFYYISTDEIFGELPLNDPSAKFHETMAFSPRSPYAASKACGNHIVQSFHHTFGMHTIISSCSNNFGPAQHEEKLIPKTIKALRVGAPVTVYGNGNQVRDWIYVGEHCRAIEMIFDSAKAGSFYCVGGNKELTNIQVIEQVAEAMNGFRKAELNLEFTNDRPTDDLRYAVDNSKVEREIGFVVNHDRFFDRLKDTVEWYLRKI